MSSADAPTVPKLAVEGLAKRYGDRVVLDGIDLAVDEHQVVCLIGPSGSGKSTILRCVDLLDTIDGGRVLLDGVDITAPDANANAVRRRIGIVFQSFNLFPHLTVVDNVTLGLRKVQKVPRADAEARAAEVLGTLGVADHRTKYPEQLSGGQQQRVALARALVAEPEVLLLDEVTSALDPELVGDVLSAIRGLADQGMTMVLATHEMGFAREVADQIAFIHEGKVLEAGPPSQVLGEPTQERTRQFLRRVLDAGRL
jgi:polar amino acid transport system ATP-binding protein